MVIPLVRARGGHRVITDVELSLGAAPHLQTHLSLFNCRVMIRVETYWRSICLAFTVDIITANVSLVELATGSTIDFTTILLSPTSTSRETYSPSLKFSAGNMLGNPFYGAHLKTNGR